LAYSTNCTSSMPSSIAGLVGTDQSVGAGQRMTLCNSYPHAATALQQQRV
jgi:hypothetical protein